MRIKRQENTSICATAQQCIRRREGLNELEVRNAIPQSQPPPPLSNLNLPNKASATVVGLSLIHI
eukprot:12441221-Ditylum_brightwellii.AAC.1